MWSNILPKWAVPRVRHVCQLTDLSFGSNLQGMPIDALPTAVSLLAFARIADDLEAQADLAADLEAAAQAASLLGGEDPILTAAGLLAGAAKALADQRLPWALLDAAERVIGDLRQEHGCEAWETADWNNAEVRMVGELAEEMIGLRQRTRALRDEQAAAALENLSRGVRLAG